MFEVAVCLKCLPIDRCCQTRTFLIETYQRVLVVNVLWLVSYIDAKRFPTLCIDTLNLQTVCVNIKAETSPTPHVGSGNLSTSRVVTEGLATMRGAT